MISKEDLMKEIQQPVRMPLYEKLMAQEAAKFMGLDFQDFIRHSIREAYGKCMEQMKEYHRIAGNVLAKQDREIKNRADAEGNQE